MSVVLMPKLVVIAHKACVVRKCGVNVRKGGDGGVCLERSAAVCVCVLVMGYNRRVEPRSGAARRGCTAPAPAADGRGAFYARPKHTHFTRT